MQGCQCHLHRQNVPQSVQSFFSTTPYHAVFGFLNPLLMGVLDAHVQDKTKSLFETHPENMWVFLVTTFIYCAAFAADIKSQIYQTNSQIFSTIAVVSGSLSSVSLVSIFLPRSCEYTLFIPWAMVPMVAAYQHATSIKDAYNWLLEKIGILWERFNGCSMQQPRLPV